MSMTIEQVPMTNREFGERVGCDHTMASRLRNGHRLPSVKLLRRIQAEFDLDLEVLVQAHAAGSKAFGAVLRRLVFDADAA